MSKRFFSTNNRRWFPVRAPRCEPWSERDYLYSLIQGAPGIGSAELQALWPFATSMRSRLAELRARGCVRDELVSDLFNPTEEQKEC